MNQLLTKFDGLQPHTEFLLRILFGVILIVAGYGKLFGVGIPGMIDKWDSTFGALAPVLGTLVPLLEFFGGIAILLGFFTRLLSVWAIVQFVVIAVILKPFLWGKGWMDFRIDVIMAVLAFYFLTHGAGPISVARKCLPGKKWAE